MGTWISTVETSVSSPKALPMHHRPSGNGSVACELSAENPQNELPHLIELIREKDARIEKLTKENEFLYGELKRLQKRIEDEFKRSDMLIDQMQAAAEESSKRAHAIIMHLSCQLEKQAEQIEILQESQGFTGAVRQTVRQLKSGFSGFGQALQARLTTSR